MKLIEPAKTEADPSVAYLMDELFTEDVSSKKTFRFGTATIFPGKRVPEEGVSCHEGDEYSYIVSGTLETMTGGEMGRISAGQASFIPAGEEHWSLNDSDEPCVVLWVMVED